jgi:hypothetical protein
LNWCFVIFQFFLFVHWNNHRKGASLHSKETTKPNFEPDHNKKENQLAQETCSHLTLNSLCHNNYAFSGIIMQLFVQHKEGRSYSSLLVKNASLAFSPPVQNRPLVFQNTTFFLKPKSRNWISSCYGRLASRIWVITKWNRAKQHSIVFR